MPFTFLKRTRQTNSFSRIPPFLVDVHAHILPGLDNGASTTEESIVLLQEMSAHGLRKVVATPHIMGEYYNNTIETILHTFQGLEAEVMKRAIPIKLDIAAEYYLDVSLISSLENNQPLLLIDNTYLLFETNIVGVPSMLKEAVRLAHQRRIKPVLVHPERYHYLQQDYQLLLELHQMGVLFQVNISSWQSTHQATRILAEKMVNDGLVAFLGSNTHNSRDWAQTQAAIKTKTFAKAIEKGLLNQELI